MLLKSLYSAIGLALVLVAWSFASPVGLSADELSHLQRIYCYTDQDACPTTVNPAIIPAQLVIGISDCWKIPRFQIVSKCEAEAASQSYIRIERPYTGKDHQVFYKAMPYFYKENWVVLYEDNWIQHLKDLLFFNPKWSPMIMGGNWTVLMIGVIGCLMLICSMQRRDSSLQITF